MMNQMPPYNMFPPAFDPNQGQGMGSNCQEKIQMLENQINRMERQLRRLDNRVNNIENSLITPYSSQNTGYGSAINKYMM